MLWIARQSIRIMSKQSSGSKTYTGIPSDLVNTEGIDESVLKNFNESMEKLKSIGYELKYKLAEFEIFIGGVLYDYAG